MNNEILIIQTLRGLKATALEKWCVLGKDAVDDILKIEGMYNDLVDFWDIDSEEFYLNLPFSSYTMYIISSIEEQQLACIVDSELCGEDIDSIYLTVQDFYSMDSRVAECGEVEHWFKPLEIE